MYGVFFRSEGLFFVDPDEFDVAALKSWKTPYDATTELAALGSQVAPGKAPLASWVLGRFAAMTESTLFPAQFVRRDSEIGGFRLRFLVTKGADPIAKIRLAAEWGELKLVATASNLENATLAARGLIQALAADPTALGTYQIEAKALELGGHRNVYGYDGVALLGQLNVYE